MQKLVTFSKIFSDINRLKILALVVREKELCVCEICDTLELSQPLVSRHLKQMREAEVLTSEQKGKWVVYALVENPQSILQCYIQQVSKISASLPILVGCSVK